MPLLQKGFLSSLGYSTFITITSVVAILVCCSMCAWYITRVNSPISKILYYLFVFSMVVPFQMVMFTFVTDSRYLTSEYAMEYLGDLSRIWRRSCGIYVLRICKIDSCRNRRSCHDRRLQSAADLLLIDIHILKPTMISVGILEAMWVWNDYLLPTLVLFDIVKKYKTIPMLIQYFRGSYGRVEMG